MDDATTIMSRSGASGEMVADFRAIADVTAPDGAPKYPPVPVIRWLARVMAGMGGGPNKDMPVFELCHLVQALNAADDGTPPADRRMSFFFGIETARPLLYRAWFRERVAGLPNDRVELGAEDLAITYPDGSFTVRFGRMPYLSALYEFLSGMNGFAHFDLINQVFDEMGDASVSFRHVQDVSNRIATELRRYRRNSLPRVQYDEKFDKVFAFLAADGAASRLRITDRNILDFWQIHSESMEYRRYKTVFDLFVAMVQSLDEADQSAGVAHAASLGPGREHQEVEASADGADIWENRNDWTSPLAVLDAIGGDINFLKKRRERAPIEALMSYGPIAQRLPHAFLRLDAFGPVQTAITTDLQVKRGAESVAARLTCKDVEPYLEKKERLNEILEHVRQLQKASLHAIYVGEAAEDETVVTLFPEESHDVDALTLAREDAAKAFRTLTRKGFDEALLLDPNHVQAFRDAAGALLRIDAQLDHFLVTMSRLDGSAENLASRFDEDRETFSHQFQTLYGETT
jgi:hypothetical protein